MGRNLNYIEESKFENINLIVDLIRRNKEISRAMLADMAKLTRMSITRIVGLLIEKGIVIENGEILAGRGRPAKMLHINPNTLYSLVVNIDVDKVTMAVVNLGNKIIITKTINVEVENTMEEYIDRIYEEFIGWKERYPNILKKVESIAFVSPGIINPHNGKVILSAQFGWKNKNLGHYASERFKMKSIVDNDVKTALLGEIAFADTIEKSNVAYMAIGYGVGVGLWLDGQILRGANNNAGEIGHISIDYNGEKCNCGRKGCLDTVLSIRSFLKRAIEIDKSIRSIKDISDKYYEGETWALELIDDASRYFSIAINNIVYSYDPDKILVGGLLFEKFPGILDIMLNSRHFQVYGDYIKKIHIEPSKLSKEAYLIGGAIRAQSYMLEKLTI